MADPCRSQINSDEAELAEFSQVYHGVHALTNSHREAFNKTACWAILEMKLPAAYWISRKTIARNQPSHALLFPMPSGLGFIGLTVGGLARLYDADPAFDRQAGRAGWKMLTGEMLGFYLDWADHECARPPTLTTVG